MRKSNCVFVSQTLKPDPHSEDWVLGWGVVKIAPWCLDSVFELKIEAELKAHLMGDGFVVQYGTHQMGTVRFIPVNDTKRVIYPDLNGFKGTHRRLQKKILR